MPDLNPALRPDQRELAGRIDHTILAAAASLDDARRTTREAADFGCASVCLNPCFLGPAVRILKDADVDPQRAPTVACTVVAFPLGAMAGHTKSVEATTAVKAGAAEIDFVAHLPHLLAGDLKAATDDFLAVTLPAREVDGDVVVKVIIESAALMSIGNPDEATIEKRIATACTAAAEGTRGPIWSPTSGASPWLIWS